jgi:hypothetical protein
MTIGTNVYQLLMEQEGAYIVVFVVYMDLHSRLADNWRNLKNIGISSS